MAGPLEAGRQGCLKWDGRAVGSGAAGPLEAGRQGHWKRGGRAIGSGAAGPLEAGRQGHWKQGGRAVGSGAGRAIGSGATGAIGSRVAGVALFRTISLWARTVLMREVWPVIPHVHGPKIGHQIFHALHGSFFCG